MFGCAFSLSFVLLLFVPSIVALRCLFGDHVFSEERDVSANCTHCFVVTREIIMVNVVARYGCIDRSAHLRLPSTPRSCVRPAMIYNYRLCKSPNDVCNRNATAAPSPYNSGQPCQPDDEPMVVEQFRTSCRTVVYDWRCNSQTIHFFTFAPACANMCWSNSSRIRCTFDHEEQILVECRKYLNRSSTAPAVLASTASLSTESVEHEIPRDGSTEKSSSSFFENPVYIAVAALAILAVVVLAIVGGVCWMRQKRERNAPLVSDTRVGGASSMDPMSSARTQSQAPEQHDKSTPAGGDPVSGRDGPEQEAVEQN